jgi:glycosyltransferase involved in cell wall biosynthesis
VITRPGTLHLCYCHTPTRFLWTDPLNYVKNIRHNFIVKKTLPLALSKLRQWDALAAHRVDSFIANSREVQKRIKKYYERTSTVIYPPVDTTKFTPRANPDNFFLTGGRLVPYKRFDLTIKTFNRLGFKLKIFGEGPAFKEYRKLAARNIEFLGRVSDETKVELFERALAFIHPQVEDFGIAAVEAMAAGRPVIAFSAGGALETILPGITGEFFSEQEWETLADALIRFQPEKYNSKTIQNHAKQFDVGVFKDKIREFVDSEWSRFQKQ